MRFDPLLILQICKAWFLSFFRFVVSFTILGAYFYFKAKYVQLDPNSSVKFISIRIIKLSCAEPLLLVKTHTTKRKKSNFLNPWKKGWYNLPKFPFVTLPWQFLSLRPWIWPQGMSWSFLLSQWSPIPATQGLGSSNTPWEIRTYLACRTCLRWNLHSTKRESGLLVSTTTYLLQPNCKPSN